LLVVIVLPLCAAVSTITEHGGDIVDQVKALPNYMLPPSPRWLHEVPLAGERVALEWQRLSDAGPGGILARVQPYAMLAAKWLLSQAGAIGMLVIHLVITVIVAGILYSQGEAASDIVVRFAMRIAAERGAATVHLGALSVRAVALGIVATAAIQARLAGLGLYVARISASGMLKVPRPTNCTLPPSATAWLVVSRNGSTTGNVAETTRKKIPAASTKSRTRRTACPSIGSASSRRRRPSISSRPMIALNEPAATWRSFSGPFPDPLPRPVLPQADCECAPSLSG
jgi:hypothetical protein